MINYYIPTAKGECEMWTPEVGEPSIGSSYHLYFDRGISFLNFAYTNRYDNSNLRKVDREEWWVDVIRRMKQQLELNP